MNELGKSKWLVYYKYRDANGCLVEDSEVISLWGNEVELDNIVKKLKPRTKAIIMNMVKLK